jgi:lipid-A-disaccharide synthase
VHADGNRARDAEGTRVLLVAGEASADAYGARVLRELRRREPEIEVFGIGGESLAAAGLERHGDAADLEIVGFTGVVSALPRLLRLQRRMRRLLRGRRPDVLVCIDLPDFNFLLARRARVLGVPALFFVSPQVWAWRPGRIARWKGGIAKMIVVLPFELPLYQDAGVPAAYHGHPLLELLVPRFASREAARRHFGLDPDRPLAVLAPGSRRSEWRHHAAALFGAGALLQREHPELQLAVPLAPRADAAQMQAAAARAGARVTCTRGDNFDLFRAADLGILCSGTATLEAALAGLPIVIFYRSNPLNAFLARRLVKIDRFGLPNIVLGGDTPVYPERLQEAASSEGRAAAARPLLEDPAEALRLRRAGAALRELLGAADTSAAVAAEILALASRSPARAEGARSEP